MKNKGFTLIELLLYVLLSASIIVGASIVYSQVIQVHVKYTAMNEVNKQGVFIAKNLSYLTTKAISINSPNIDSSSNSLSLEMNDTASNPTIIELNNGIIEINKGNSTDNLTGSNIEVTNLIFTNLSYQNTPGVVKVEYTLKYKSNSNRKEYNYSRKFTTSYSLRN